MFHILFSILSSFVWHYGIATGIVILAVVGIVMAPSERLKWMALVAGVGAALWGIGYFGGERDGSAYWKGQLGQYKLAVATVTDAQLKQAKADAAAALAALGKQLDQNDVEAAADDATIARLQAQLAADPNACAPLSEEKARAINLGK